MGLVEMKARKRDIHRKRETHTAWLRTALAWLSKENTAVSGSSVSSSKDGSLGMKGLASAAPLSALLPGVAAAVAAAGATAAAAAAAEAVTAAATSGPTSLAVGAGCEVLYPPLLPPVPVGPLV